MRSVLKALLIVLMGATFSYAQLPPTGIKDEGGAESKPVFTIDCVGAGISCSHSGSTGTLTVSGSTGSGSASGNDTEIIYFEGTSLVGNSGLVFDYANTKFRLQGTATQTQSFFDVRDSSGLVLMDFSTTDRLLVDDITLKPPATCTVCSSTTTIGEKNCDRVSDGTDDDVDIQWCLDRIEAAGATGAVQGGSDGKGTVQLTEGTFTLGNPVSIRPGSKIRGEGVFTATVVKAADSFPASRHLFEFDESSAGVYAGFAFEWLYFDGNRTNTTSVGAFNSCRGTQTIWDVHFVHNAFFDFSGTAINMCNPWGFRFVRNHIEDSDQGGIYIDSSVGTKQNGAFISDNKIIQIGDSVSPTDGFGIKLKDIIGSHIVQNEMNTSDSGSFAIELESSSGVIVSNNLIYNTTSTTLGGGIDLAADTQANIIVDNIFTDIGGTEIDYAGTNNIAMSNRGDDTLTNTFVVPNAWDINNTVTIASATTINDGRNAADFAVHGQSTDNIFACVGSANECRLGAAGTSDYMKFDNVGGMTPNTNNSGLIIPNDFHIFKLQADTDAGMAYQSSTTQYNFVDASQNGVSWIHATSGDAAFGGKVLFGGTTTTASSCASVDSDRVYGDKDCDGVKDSGEWYWDQSKEEDKSIVILSPTTDNTNDIQLTFKDQFTFERVYCSTDSGTLTIQLDERAEGTPNSAGTNILSANLACDTDTEATTSFANWVVDARDPINLQLISTSGTPPGAARIHFDGTVSD